MAALPRLLVFCDYLKNRLHTSSLSLLRRILIDFYAGNEHTLVDFMRLGASVVSVMPIEKTNPHHRKAATQLLIQQNKGDNYGQKEDEALNQVDIHQPTQILMDTIGSQQLKACVFRFLSARVATKNILWLRDMYYEFCKGEDAILHAFVMRGNEPICVIPVDIQALGMAPLPPSPLTVGTIRKMKSDASVSTSSLATTPSQTLSPQRKRRREKEREQQDTNEVRQSIVTAMKRIEEKEPWKCTFKIETLVMPFSRIRHPKLAEALQTFWETHARAVWERKFWSPLLCPRTHQLHNERRCRQSKALVFFEKRVLFPVYKDLGASFFVDMDRRRTPYSGWFYLDEAVDLFTLTQRYSLSVCLQYIELEAWKRFPIAPGVGRRFFSESMWSSSAQLRPVLSQIIAAKAKTDVKKPS
ncbi:hypothetical protein DD238_008007 [Peronospora effusa]|uniref:Uncharacterized protein n=1 Tax=Peronospora effusa TaxID=542832 RepID=A0A3M6V9K5_9STRA|nr:hypothetical protein DD238_008007 [Peronospora effusa]RQM12671.1 hypothetical protein DD237_007478 [Peronospora effusa]